MKGKQRVRSMVLAVSWILILALAGCSSAKQSTPAPGKETPSASAGSAADAKKLESLKLTVATARDPNLAAPLIVATRSGILAKRGLDVEVKFFQTGGELVSAAASGSIKLAITGDAPALNLRAGGANVQVLAQTADISGAQAILVKPEYANALGKLKGARIAVLKGTVGELFLYRFLESVGVKKEDVHLFQLGGGDAITAFVRGDIDAMYEWEPWVQKAKEMGGRVVTTANFSFEPGKEGPRKLVGIHAVLMGATDFVKANPNSVQALLGGLAEAVTQIQTNFDASVQLVATEMKLDPKVAAVIMKENVYQMVINQELVQDLDVTAKFLNESGALKAVPAAADWINPSLLKAVRPEWAPWQS